MNFKEYSFLDKSILIKFPNDWIVKEQDDNLIKVSFPSGPYPTLDCYLSCFDNPKINTEDKIKQYLLNGIDTGQEVENILDNLYVLKHKFKSEGDNLLLIKIVSILKPRTFREVRFSLAWPDNEEANKIVSKISKTLENVISKIKFSEVKTAFDELGIIKNKLDNLILQKNVFWEKLEILLPKKWIINNNFVAKKFKNILLIGIGYKANVNDIRHSPALSFVDYFEKKNIKFSYYDQLIPKFTHNKRNSKHIKFLIFHYTGMKKESEALKKLTKIQSEVSSHYFIKNNGDIVLLVPDLYIAWHAGKSSWKSYEYLNKYSIGIEINNPGHQFNYKRFSKKQIKSILNLSKFLIKKYKINSKNILGHSDISHNRKKD